MRHVIPAMLVVALVLVSTVALLYLNQPGSPLSGKTVTSTTSMAGAIPVGAVLYLWYGNATTGKGGLSSPGWNSTGCPGGGAVVDKPDQGYYVSDSNQTFKAQIEEMQSTGISFAVVSWWGPFTQGEAGAINKATHDLFSYLEATNSTFKVAIMVDAFPGTCNPPLPSVPMSKVYNYVYSDFAGPFKHWYFDWQDKPLLMTFNPVAPLYNDTRFTSRMIGNYACEPAETCASHSLNQRLNWIWWEAPARYFQSQAGAVNATNDEGQPVISLDGEVTIVPRIDSYYNQPYQDGAYLRFDANLSLGLYQEQWSYVLNHSASVKLVLIYGWNEYHERTSIEPHIDGSTMVQYDYLLNLTSIFVSELVKA